MSSAEEPLPEPSWMKRFPYSVGRRLFLPGDIRATPAQLAAFREFATKGDPLADAVAAMMRERPGGRALFERAVVEGMDKLEDPPRELVEFFADVEAVPFWLDRRRVEEGARVLGRTGLFGLLLVMPAMALYGGYLASRADKTLVRTGDLQSSAPRRLAETAGWWVDVTSPGGLSRFAPGYTGTLRVRVMHAHVRAAMHRREDWDYEAWDHPVNQVQMAGTLQLFCLVLLLGSRVLGLRFSAKDKAAVFHLWRYVGHLMGVDPRLVPASEQDARRLFWLEGATEFLPDADSKRLGTALMAAAPPLLLPPRWKNSPRAGKALTSYLGSFSRIVLGRRNADFLGAADSRLFRAAVAATAGVNFAVESVRMLLPGATGLSARAGQHLRSRAVTRMLQEQKADTTYTRHDTLAATSNP